MRAAPIARSDRVVVGKRRELEHAGELDDHLARPGWPRHAAEPSRLPVVPGAEDGEPREMIAQTTGGQVFLEFRQDRAPPKILGRRHCTEV